MIAIFDVGGPLILYALLALVLSGILPAFGVAITGIQFRRLDIFGLMVLAGILIGSVLGRGPGDLLARGRPGGAVVVLGQGPVLVCGVLAGGDR
jgi:hypothetical protein